MPRAPHLTFLVFCPVLSCPVFTFLPCPCSVHLLQLSVVLQGVTHRPQPPLKRALFWVLSFLVPGLGMFSEAYWVFSVGNLKGIFGAEYKTCWKSHTSCSAGLINSLTYTTVHFQHCSEACTPPVDLLAPLLYISLNSSSVFVIALFAYNHTKLLSFD